jgi:ParB-like chromosome segregation protein Spo0J
MKVKDVKRNKDNPPIRTDRDNKFKKLLTSVSKYGLISPIVVSSNNVLINGTRRLAVHKDLGKKKY